MVAPLFNNRGPPVGCKRRTHCSASSASHYSLDSGGNARKWVVSLHYLTSLLSMDVQAPMIRHPFSCLYPVRARRPYHGVPNCHAPCLSGCNSPSPLSLSLSPSLSLSLSTSLALPHSDFHSPSPLSAHKLHAGGRCFTLSFCLGSNERPKEKMSGK